LAREPRQPRRPECGTGKCSLNQADLLEKLAGNAASQTVAPASLAYANPGRLFDITTGMATGICSPLYLCKAGQGYDGPTGLGTPKGLGAY
jgi:hypothetical protein